MQTNEVKLLLRKEYFDSLVQGRREILNDSAFTFQLKSLSERKSVEQSPVLQLDISHNGKKIAFIAVFIEKDIAKITQKNYLSVTLRQRYSKEGVMKKAFSLLVQAFRYRNVEYVDGEIAEENLASIYSRSRATDEENGQTFERRTVKQKLRVDKKNTYNYRTKI